MADTLKWEAGPREGPRGGVASVSDRWAAGQFLPGKEATHCPMNSHPQTQVSLTQRDQMMQHPKNQSKWNKTSCSSHLPVSTWTSHPVAGQRLAESCSLAPTHSAWVSVGKMASQRPGAAGHFLGSSSLACA